MEKKSKGWIKAWRDVQDHWIWNSFKHSEQSAWFDLIMTVNHAPTKLAINHQIVEIKPGQTWTSVRQLAVRWKWSVERTLKFLNMLQSEGMIYKSSNTYGTLITVVNYGLYQSSDEATPNAKQNAKQNTDLITPQNTDRTQNRHKQEVKNIKNDIKNEKEEGAAPILRDSRGNIAQ